MADTYLRKVLEERHWILASERVDNSPIYENSHRKKSANQVGFLGEVVIEEFFRENGVNFSDEREKTTHDYLINGNITLDVKTKDRTVRLKKDYDNSVPLYNHSHQRPDYYYFISLLRNRSDNSECIRRFTEAYLVGGIDLETLERIGKHWKKGEIDTRNGTEFWTDCINVSMEQLINNRDMIEIFTSKIRKNN